MQMRKTLGTLMVAVGATLASAGHAMAAAWTPPSGATSTYIYSGGMDTDGHFGSPTGVTTAGFEFQPTSFRAISTNGSATLVSDTLQVNVSDPNQQKSIHSVNLSELGDFTIDNGGGVKAFAGLFVRVLDSDWSFSTRVYTADFTSTPGFPVNSAGDAQGNWSGGVVVNLPAGARSISITVNNTLQAHSNVNGSALIQKKEVDLDFNGNTSSTPEPVTLVSIVGGLGVATLRRRKA